MRRCRCTRLHWNEGKTERDPISPPAGIVWEQDEKDALKKGCQDKRRQQNRQKMREGIANSHFLL